MSDEERGDSLADQAAAWVPPWDRPRPPASTPAEPPKVAETAEPPETAEVAEPPEVAETAEPAEVVTVPPVPTEDLGSKAPLQGPESSKIDNEPVEPVEPAVPGEPVGSVVASGSQGVPRREVVGRRRVTAAPEPAPDLPDAELRGALEAILLVVDEPVSELVLAQVLEQSAERIGPMLDEIAAGYTAAGHGFELRRAAGGWRLYTRPEYATYVERFVLDGQSVRLTQAALETLAVVAYKQPVTRSRISAIRGVNCDGVIRTLVTRGLVEECGAEPDSGAFLYRTTTLFLEKLGLNTVDELPPLAPFLPDDVEELADATR
ncbi:SMC-Scp complex subunit ScpB [Micromonospora lupini]|uniref:SMC-Scp complex subunit ScpB n=1 Tax=Micromonospora lupini TaxID=285679 RepID=UPI0033C3353A